jgi:CBS domain-containing protein
MYPPSLIPINSVMNKRPVTVPGFMPMADSANQMLKYNSDYVIVIDDELRPVGIVTSRDLVRIMASARGWGNMRIDEAMTPNPTTLIYTASVADCMDGMQKLGFKHMPVVDGDGRLVGIVTLNDLLFLESSIVVETHPVVLYVISNNNGLLLFEYQFTTEEESISGDLFTGAFASFGSIFQEVLHSNGNRLNYIEVENRAILVEHGHWTIAILVQDKESIDSRKRLKNFLQEFENEYAFYLENFSETVPLNTFDPARDIVEEVFSSKIRTVKEEDKGEQA